MIPVFRKICAAKRALPAPACPSPGKAPPAPAVVPASMMPKAARERTVSVRAQAPHSLRLREGDYAGLDWLPPGVESTSKGTIPRRRIFAMFKLGWLRSFGPAGTAAATAITFLTTNWPLTMSAILGVVAAIWSSALSFFQFPAVQVGVGVFLAALWTTIGILHLIDRTRPRLVRQIPDYRYGLTFEGILPNTDLKNEDMWLSFVLQIRNFSQAPIRYEVEQFDFRIATRALPKPTKKLVGYLARGGGKQISPSQFKKDEVREYFDKRVKGTAEIVVAYGHPEEKPVRRLIIKAEITLHLPPDGNGQMGFGADILEENDAT